MDCRRAGVGTEGLGRCVPSVWVSVWVWLGEAGGVVVAMVLLEGEGQQTFRIVTGGDKQART